MRNLYNSHKSGRGLLSGTSNGNHVKVDGPAAELSGARRAVYAARGENVAPLECPLERVVMRPLGTARPPSGHRSGDSRRRRDRRLTRSHSSGSGRPSRTMAQ